jgi:acyl carrier protein
MTTPNPKDLSTGNEQITADERLAKIVEILTPYVTSEDAPVGFKEEYSLLGDLLINSARLIDIVLDFESEFDIAIDDDELDKLKTVGDALEIVRQKSSSS